MITEVVPSNVHQAKEEPATTSHDAKTKDTNIDDNIEAIAQRVAQINFERGKNPQRGSGFSNNRRGRGRGRGRAPNRGRGEFRGGRGNNSGGYGYQGR